MLIRKNVEWTQILSSQGTNSHGVSKKHPNRLVHNCKYCSWTCNRISDHGLLSHSHTDRMESKECCRTRQTEPRLPLEITWVMLSHDRRCQVFLPQTDFHGYHEIIILISAWEAEEGMARSLLSLLHGANTNQKAAQNPWRQVRCPKATGKCHPQIFWSCGLQWSRVTSVRALV